MKLLIALFLFTSAIYISQEKEKGIPTTKPKEQIDSLKAVQIQQENIRLRKISLKLYQYADPNKIKKDDELVSDMISYSSTELKLNK